MNNIILFRIIANRPSIDIPWKNKILTLNDAEFNEYVNKNYFDTGKFLVRGTTLSDDLLVLIHATQWSSETNRLEYINDPIVKKRNSLLASYCRESGIRVRFDRTEFDTKNNILNKNEGVLIE